MKFRKKVYGESKLEHCPFCGRIATLKNDSGLLVCPQHLKTKLEEIRCSCGGWLEQRAGKFGPYFNCLKCGNINFKKGMEMKGLMKVNEVKAEVKKEITQTERGVKQELREKKEPKEIIISTNDVEYFD